MLRPPEFPMLGVTLHNVRISSYLKSSCSWTDYEEQVSPLLVEVLLSVDMPFLCVQH